MRGWQFKVCLMGNGFVGKTSIRRKYLKEGFKRSYIPSLGVDFAQKSITFEGTPTNLVIWDIAGQDAYRGMRKKYYGGTRGMILVYSVVDRDSFDDAAKWLVEAHEFVEDLPPLIIASNKVDLRPDHPANEVVSTEEGQAFSERFAELLNTSVRFIETSALSGENIEAVFEELTKMMVERYIRETPAERAESTTPFVSSHSETSTEESADDAVSSDEIATSEVDPVTSLESDSEYLEEDQIGRAMVQLRELREELSEAEEGLAKVMSELETKLFTLRNIVHVKKITYEHLKAEQEQTRQDWAEAYEEYERINEQKKAELAKRSDEIRSIRDSINKIGKTIRQRVSDLDIKSMSG